MKINQLIIEPEKIEEKEIIITTAYEIEKQKEKQNINPTLETLEILEQARKPEFSENEVDLIMNLEEKPDEK